MEIVQKVISLEPHIDRRDYSPTYGTLTATSFYVNVLLTQNFEDGGQFTDATYIPINVGISAPPDYTILINKLAASGITFPFMHGITPVTAETTLSHEYRVTGLTESSYYEYPNTIVTGTTESRAKDATTYDKNNKYVLNFDTNSQIYTDFKGNIINGVDRITHMGNPLVYVFGADKNDVAIGTINQQNGIVFQDSTGNTVVSSFSFVGQGYNMTNTSLSAITKEEYLFGIISTPEVKSDIFIDRGITTVFERHLKLSEITNLNELQRYGRGYYNLTKQ